MCNIEALIKEQIEKDTGTQCVAVPDVAFIDNLYDEKYGRDISFTNGSQEIKYHVFREAPLGSDPFIRIQIEYKNEGVEKFIRRRIVKLSATPLKNRPKI